MQTSRVTSKSATDTSVTSRTDNTRAERDLHYRTLKLLHKLPVLPSEQIQVCFHRLLESDEDQDKMINHIKEVIYRAREDMIQDTAFILFNKWKKEQEDHKEAEQEDHKEEEQEEAIIS
ncbi:hypothetical protein TVAG_111390 [Trichomonas vaginalis G3]|uniref:Uncharacterized protein n=1 Tax=Trichomonas vaginalis (strain ATCC PRA-98 / G3) TaxID=412133 RepID=A2EZZ8_TRIV3|nr:hypothetical protein TVAGG3_0144700 [Trichomonas vaginalis G3]EAY01782.1 hypothetical protein TVAG_111390 [Trichomonas vaginalis G3]KAI5546836.1 hypothetical protein TVAGG3_0144700 [Trichomonas vaginalis G3]|eukprot:XP_001314340.1 hypothetical protein [Trichomonas vaginalis G3]